MEAIPLPNRAHIEDLGSHKYKVTLDPLYPGYGVTIGNTLRRVLLSSMPGAAVTAVKIKFVDHEFSTIPHVKEDVIQVILNLKQLHIRSHSAEPLRLSLKVKGERTVTAGDIEVTDQVEILNPELHIATLDNKSAEFDAEILVEQGRGYVPVEARENVKLETGMLAIDAVFTPVRSVFFDISHVRVGQITNFDKLEMVLETNGTITGNEALDIASHILVDHFSMMFSATPTEFSAPEVAEVAMDQEGETEIPMDVEGQETDLDTIQLSTRARNALMKTGISTVAALQALSDDDINNIDGLGKKTITEILTALGRV